MHPLYWIPPAARRILDVGCNVGALLTGCAEMLPEARLAGVDVNAAAVRVARDRVPGADLRLVTGSLLPFEDAAFDWVTCIEVLEHIPAERRRASLEEMARVLAPGGRLVVRVPHAGMFAWMDAANLRHRFPTVYARLVGRGLRDDAYPNEASDIVWHHHFSEAELRALMPPSLAVEHLRFGGLFLFPAADLLCWPFYRTMRSEHAVARGLGRIAETDYGVNYGRWSYGILMVLRKA